MNGDTAREAERVAPGPSDREVNDDDGDKAQMRMTGNKPEPKMNDAQVVMREGYDMKRGEGKGGNNDGDGDKLMMNMNVKVPGAKMSKTGEETKRKPGRPKGSKNKDKRVVKMDEEGKMKTKHKAEREQTRMHVNAEGKIEIRKGKEQPQSRNPAKGKKTKGD